MSEKYKALLPVVDTYVQRAASDLAENGTPVSCGKGCDYCCHLLIEVSWSEAEILVEWIDAQPAEAQGQILSRIATAAKERKKLFKKRKSSRRLLSPTRKREELADEVFNEYFFGKSRPCPFLVDGACSAYEARPVTCRLHLVTSPPESCSRTVGQKEHYDAPARIDQLQDEVTELVQDVDHPAWGEMTIMIMAYLDDRAAKSTAQRQVA